MSGTLTVAPHLVRLMHRPAVRARLGPEDRISIEFADRLRGWTLDGRLKAVWTHVGNEVGGGRGVRSEIAYAVAKALGLITGTADYFFAWDGGAGFIEFKAPKGRPTQAQMDFGQWCDAKGVPWKIAHSADEGEVILRQWGALV